MSMNPGIAVVSVAETSLAPAGKRRLLRGPTASITSSRIRIPASLISEAGVKARPAWIRVVGMVVEHRNGNVGRDKTRWANQGIEYKASALFGRPFYTEKRQYISP